MKRLVFTLLILFAVLGVSAQKFVQINEMQAIPYAGEPPSDANFSAKGNWAVIDVFAADADNMNFNGGIVVETKKIIGGWRLYVYIPTADKEILVLKDGMMPFHLKIPNGTLINKKLYRVELEIIDEKVDVYEYVDLGLPSGTLWATCNVDAKNPWDCGTYFAWGETWQKNTYSWNNYQLCKDGDYHSLTKYCSKSDYGYNHYTDGNATLERSDDAAMVNWKTDWCMPTATQYQELISNCTCEWTSNYNNKGVAGKIFKSKKNGGEIFFPAGGYRWDDGTLPSGADSYGYYWSSSLDSNSPNHAQGLRFNSDDVFLYCGSRCTGLPVRAVRKSNNLPTQPQK